VDPLQRPAGEKIPDETLAAYLDLLDGARGVRNALMVAPRLAELDAKLPLTDRREIRVAVLGNATLDQLRDCLLVECYREGWLPRMYLAGFDQYAQEILEPASGLYAFKPDVVILALHSSRLFPNLHDQPFALPIADRQNAMATGLDAVRRLLDAFRRHSHAQVLLHNMVQPQHPALGILDWRDPLGQHVMFSEINMRLAAIARDELENVHILDVDLVESRCGKSRATDARMWLAARLPWSEAMLQELTSEHMRFLRAFVGQTRKCLVLDLDGTLWGGVAGEDGLAGVRLGADPPGNAYVLFQREILKLWTRGVLLAICSKNNPEDALQVLRHHPAMVLRESHFAAQRINWQPKPANLKEIAAELNIGLDSLVFLDDSAAERGAVRAELPAVLCPDLPSDPASYRPALLGLGVFESVALTDEDRRRNEMYTQQKERSQLQSQHQGGSLESHLAELGTSVEIFAATASVLPRLAQLTQKTNQFNMTTQRCSEARITELEDSGSLVYGMRLEDRFGDSGVVGLAIASPRSREMWELNNLLLSCRVIGRGAESALLAHVSDEVHQRGATRLQGWFLPTPRNIPARECYRMHGFRLIERRPDGGELWEFELEGGRIAVPDWIRVRPAGVTVA
jgi:FkbH-like protein